MSGYDKKEDKQFNEFVDKNIMLYKKKKKPKKVKRKRGLKKGEWKGGKINDNQKLY